MSVNVGICSLWENPRENVDNAAVISNKTCLWESCGKDKSNPALLLHYIYTTNINIRIQGLPAHLCRSPTISIPEEWINQYLTFYGIRWMAYGLEAVQYSRI